MKNFKVVSKLTALTAGAVVMTFCAPKPAYHTFDGFALGTSYHIIINDPDTAGFRRAVDSVFTVANNSVSIYNPHSLLSRINRNETDSLDSHIMYCIEMADMVSAASGGIYDITVKPLTEAWGFTGQEAVEQPDVDSLLQYVGYEKIRISDGRLVKERPEIQIDLNSIAKGYTVDLLGQMIRKRGVKDYMVEVGGEIFCRGKNSRGQSWVVGIDKPVDGNVIPGMALQEKLRMPGGKGLATSGNYRRFYIDDHGRKIVHTINAKTGRSQPSDLLSVTVIADNTTSADALATAFMALGLEGSRELLEKHQNIMALLIYAADDGSYSIYVTPNLREYIIQE